MYLRAFVLCGICTARITIGINVTTRRKIGICTLNLTSPAFNVSDIGIPRAARILVQSAINIAIATIQKALVSFEAFFNVIYRGKLNTRINLSVTTCPTSWVLCVGIETTFFRYNSQPDKWINSRRYCFFYVGKNIGLVCAIESRYTWNKTQVRDANNPTTTQVFLRVRISNIGIICRRLFD